MIRHADLGKANFEISRALFKHIVAGNICFGGNSVLKIYGKLDCRSGKRMLRKNRVFFRSEQEAIHSGYRPCGHCMKEKYMEWKKVVTP